MFAEWMNILKTEFLKIATCGEPTPNASRVLCGFSHLAVCI